jgi:flagellar assembly protein FliH
VIKAGQVHLDAGQRVPVAAPLAAVPAAVSAEEMKQALVANAMAQAQQVLDTARDQAAELRRAAALEAAEIARQARQEGLAAAEAEVAALLASAHAVLDETQAWQRQVLAQSEPAVLALVTTVAQTLFGDGLELPLEQLRAAFAHALNEARPLGALRLRVNPADAALLDQRWPETGTGQTIQLVPDSTIRRGGCQIDGEYGSVDARVETQLQIVAEALADAAGAGEPVSTGREMA